MATDRRSLTTDQEESALRAVSEAFEESARESAMAKRAYSPDAAVARADEESDYDTLH